MSEQIPESQSGETKATGSEWGSEKLSELFPDGALVTFVQGTEETSKHDGSSHDATDSIQMREDEEGNVTFTFWSLNTGRQFIVPVESVEERWYGLFVTPTETGMERLMLSHEMSEKQRQFIKDSRESDF